MVVDEDATFIPKCQRHSGNVMEMQVFAKFFVMPLSTDSFSGCKRVSQVLSYRMFVSLQYISATFLRAA